MNRVDEHIRATDFNVKQIFKDHTLDEKTAAVVLLGEADIVSGILQNEPWIQEERNIEENHIFELDVIVGIQGNERKAKYLGSFT